jgi:hypothetical protein
MNKFEKAILEFAGPENAQTTFLNFLSVMTYIQSWNNLKEEIEPIVKKLNNYDLTVTFPSIYSLLAEEMLLKTFSTSGNDILGTTNDCLKQRKTTKFYLGFNVKTYGQFLVQ